MTGTAPSSRRSHGHLLLLILASSWSVHAAEVSAQCNGVFAFAVSAAEVDVIDQAVADKMRAFHSLAPWVSDGCKQALRTNECMLTGVETAASAAGKAYCRQDCEKYVAQCAKAAAVLGEFFEAFMPDCQLLPEQNCMLVQQTSQLAAPAAQCPNELVIPDSDSKDDGATIHWADGSACAVPCPNDLVLSMGTWQTYTRLMLAVSAAGFLAGVITLLCHIRKRLWTIVTLSASCTLMSLFLMIQAAMNLDFEHLCQGNAGFVEHGDFCMVVAGVMMSMTIWFCGWTLEIVSHLWLALVKRWNQERLTTMRVRCGIALGLACVALVVIPFATGNVGFDWTGATGPMCYYITTETPVYFWTVQWLPLILITIAGLGLSFTTVHHMTKELSRTQVNKASRVDTRALFWKYSGKQIVYAGLVLGATVAVLLITISLEVETANLRDDIDEYITCLLQQASSSPDKHCDRPSDNVSWQLMVLICYSGLLGLFPLAAFGTAGVTQDFMEKRKHIRDTENESKLSCVFENPMNQADSTERQMEQFNVDDNRPSISDPDAAELRKLCRIANAGVVPDRWTSVVVTRQFIL